MKVEMTNDERSGWLHNHIFIYVEDLWERPLAWVCRLFCGELKMETYKRRVDATEDQKREIRVHFLDEEEISREIREETVHNQKDVIQKNRAAKLELALFVTIMPVNYVSVYLKLLEKARNRHGL